MEICGNYIVVKVSEDGGGLISPAFSEKYAIEHWLQWEQSIRDNRRENKVQGFTKIFDKKGNEYKVEKDGAGYYLATVLDVQLH